MIKAARIGVIYSPPTFVVEYSCDKDLDVGNVDAAKRHRHFRLHNLSNSMDSFAVSTLLLEKFPAYFSNIPFDQVRRMVTKIVESISPSVQSPVERRLKDITLLGDLNRVEPEVLASAKEQMDVIFNTAAIKPGDRGYEYDKKIDFDEPADDCSWD